MKESCKTVERNGVVTSIDEQSATVRIERTSACASCHAAKSCDKTGSREVDVVVKGPHVSEVDIGDRVVVALRVGMARSAVIYGFGLPLAILLISFLLTGALCNNDLIISVVSLGMVFTYYFVMYLLRERLESKFLFEIKDIKKA